MPSWPHAPSHEVTHPGAYTVTASTYGKEKLFNTEAKLDLLESTLLSSLDDLGWSVQAWAVFANHYHFVGFSPESGLNLRAIARAVHETTAREINRTDDRAGRMVWYRSWDTRLTFSRSYMARLAYVHGNPVKHGLVRDSADYRWCSARWFAEKANRPFYESVMRFKTDNVNVVDDF